MPLPTTGGEAYAHREYVARATTLELQLANLWEKVRGVRLVGTADNFAECFLGEGNVNLPLAMKTFKECGFTGFFIDDHVPHMVDDSDWGHRGRAFANGYMLALLNAVNTLS